MRPRLIEAHPLVEETLNQVAVKRGPIVYCSESCDLPDGVRVRDIRVPADSKLNAQYENRLLSGVKVIEGKVFAKPTASWESSLYRPLRVDDEREIKARFIPYYVWANREPSEMSVWLPLK
jgi:uncharacterized protein